MIMMEFLDGIASYVAECPGCKTRVSAILHDFSLCTELQNALYRIRELEKPPKLLKMERV